MTVGGHWFCSGSRLLLGLGSRAWWVLREGSVGWVVRLAGDCGARLMVVMGAVAATTEIGRKGG